MSYYVGIDVAKFKHDYAIISSNGEVISRGTFNNDSSGFNTFKDSLDKLDHSQKIKIGLESTGHYHKNLVKFLSNSGNEVNVLNPYLVHKFIDSRTLRKSKTDKLDAMHIASYLSTEDFKTYQEKLYNAESLKSLTRNRDKLVSKRSEELVIVTNCLDAIFPEFKKSFDGKLSKTALCLLYEYNTTEQIANITLSEIQDLKKKYKNLSLNKIMTIRDQAKITVGNPDPAKSFIMKQSISIIFQLNQSIDEYEDEIKKIMKEFDSKLLTIPGVGINSAAAIIGEFNNFNGFPNADKLLAYAGMECSRYQSGTMDCYGHMVKRGSPHLRYVLMNLAIALKNHNSIFANYYLKKKDEGKYYRVALTHVVRKFLRIAFKLVSSNEEFNIDNCK